MAVMKAWTCGHSHGELTHGGHYRLGNDNAFSSVIMAAVNDSGRHTDTNESIKGSRTIDAVDSGELFDTLDHPRGQKSRLDRLELGDQARAELRVLLLRDRILYVKCLDELSGAEDGV